MPKWLITGSGMLAHALQTQAQRLGAAAHMPGHAALDVTDADSFLKMSEELQPDCILHSAALTRVNYCEQHRDEAMLVNTLGAANARDAAEAVGASLIYFSTDYVFDGKAGQALDETAEPSPLNEYGRSKLRGELALSDYARAYVVRTSGVFGTRPDHREMNFFKAIYSQLAAGDQPLEVVGDIRTCVTYAPHLAEITLDLFMSEQLPRLAHITSGGSDTWAGWARATAAAAGFDPSRVREISAIERPKDAPRPAISVLSTIHPQIQKLIAAHPASTGLAQYVAILAHGQSGS